MKVTPQKATEVIVNYLETELSKISDPIKRFATMFAVGAMAANPSSLTERAKTLGVIDEQGMIDTDYVRSGFSMAFRNGNTVDLLGLTFSQSDGDELVRHLEM